MRTIALLGVLAIVALARSAAADEAMARKLGFPKDFDPVAEALKDEGRKDWKPASREINAGLPQRPPDGRGGRVAGGLRDAARAQPLARNVPKQPQRGARQARFESNADYDAARVARARRTLAARQRALAEIAGENAYRDAQINGMMAAAMRRSGW